MMTNPNCFSLGMDSSTCIELFNEAFDGLTKVEISDKTACDNFLIENGMTDLEREALLKFSSDIDNNGSLSDRAERDYVEITTDLAKLK